MTWNEFKEHIEHEIKSRGYDGSIDIHYIDSSCHGEDEVDVMISEDGMLEVY